MSQKRPREGEGSGDYNNNYPPGSLDRDRVNRSRRRSIGHRSPSAVRGTTRPAHNSHSSLYVDTVSLDHASQSRNGKFICACSVAMRGIRLQLSFCLVCRLRSQATSQGRHSLLDEHGVSALSTAGGSQEWEAGRAAV